MRGRLWGATALTTAAFVGSAGHVLAEDLWTPQLRAVIGADQDGVKGTAEAFAPITQSGESAVIIDLRVGNDFQDGPSTDLGAIYRRIVTPDLALGGYGYVSLQDVDGNAFGGGTLGVEAIATQFDAHVNLHIPFSGDKTERSSNSSLSFVGNQLLEQVSVLDRRDFPMWGIEGEFGVQVPLPLPKGHGLRLAVGGYHFWDSEDSENIDGGKAGFEYRIDDIFQNGRDASLVLGGEVRHDNEDGTNFVGTLRLSIPFGGPDNEAVKDDREPVSIASEGLRRRLNDRVRGDIGVRVETEETVTSASRLAINPATNTQYGLFFFADGENTLGLGTQGDPTTLDDAVAKAGRNGFIVALGGKGDITTAGATLNVSQTLIGGGRSIPVRLIDGNTVNFNFGGSDGTIRGTNPAANVISLANYDAIVGVTITGGNAGIFGNNVTGTQLTDVTVAGAGGDGARFTGAATRVAALDFTATGNGGSGLSLGDGTYNFAGTTTLSGNAADGLTITGNGTYNFQTINAQNNADDGIDVTSTSGTFTTTGGTISGNGDIGVKIDPINANVVLTSITQSGGTSGVLLDNVAGSFTVTGPTTISNTAGPGIAISNSPASIRFGDIAIDNPGGDGMTFAGTNGPVVVGGIVITGISAGNAGLDFSGSKTSFTAQSVNITGTGAAGSIGIDLATTLGGAAITITNGGTIANVDTGVRLGIAGSPTDTANANFTFGGGSIGGLTASLDGRGLNPVSGSYAFGSTVFNGPQLFAAANVIFVGAAATGAGDGSSVNDLATIDTADAITAADAVFVLVNNGTPIVDADGFTLGSSQTFASFGNGAQYALGGLPLNVTGVNVQNGAVQSDPTGNGAATLTSGAAAGTITLADGTFLADINLAGTGAGNVVNLGSNTSLDGVDVSGGSVGVFGNNISGATLTNVAISGASSHGASFTGTSTNISASNFSASGNGGSGLSITSGGLFNFTGTTLLSGNVADGLTIAGTGTYHFQTLNAQNNTSDGIDVSGGGRFTTTGGTVSGNAARGIGLANLTAGVVLNSITHSGGTTGIDLNAVGGSLTVSGATTISNTAVAGIVVANSPATLTFAAVNITSPGGDGIAYSGVNGATSAGAVTIGGLGAGDTGLDFSGSGASFSATSVNITGTNAAGSTGIDLSGTQSGTIGIGSGSTIANVDTGVQLGSNGSGAATANTTFTFGGGTIQGTTASLDMRGLLAGSGTYTFSATSLIGPQLFDATNIVFVGATNTGSGSGTTVNDLINAAAADDLTTDPNTIFALVGTAAGQVINTDADGFTLAQGQSLVSFANGATVNLSGPPSNVIGTNGTNLVTGGPQTDPFGFGAPTLNNPAGNAIDLSNGNVVSNLIATAGLAAVNGSGGINGLTSSGLEIRGAATGLLLDGALGTITVSNLNIVGPVQTGISLANTAATLNFTGTTRIAGGTNASLLANNFDGNATFADLDITGGNMGISVLNGSSGALSFGAPSSIAGTSGVAFSIDSSAPTVTYNGIITQTSAANAVDINGMSGGSASFGGLITAHTGAANAIDLTSNAGGTINFGGGLHLETDGGFALRAIDGGTLTVTGSNNSVTTGAGVSENGILVGGTGMTIGAAGVNFSSVTVDGSGGTVATGIVIENTSGGSVTFGDVDIFRVNGDAVLLTNVSGTYTFSGTTTIGTVVAGGPGFVVANSSAAVNVANLVTTGVAGADVSLANNTGTVTIAGTLTNTGTGDGVLVSGGSAVINIGATVNSSAGLGGAAVRVDGISGGSVNLSGSIASTGAGNLFNIGTTTAPTGGTITLSGAGKTASGGGNAVIAGLGAGAAVNVNAPVTVSGSTGSGISVSNAAGAVTFGSVSVTNSAGDGISITNSSGSLTFGGQTTITNPGSAGVDIEGTNGAISFANLDIALQTNNTSGFDLSNAVVGGAINAADFDLTSTTATGTVGVNLVGATRTGTQSVVLGDPAGNGASIAGVATGVLFSSSTNLDFTFGDGEAVADIQSTIAATRPVDDDGTGLPDHGTDNYNFLDVNLIGDTSGLAGPTYFVVDNLASAGAGTFLDPGTIQQAEASGADVIVLVDSTTGGVSNLIDLNTAAQVGGGNNTLDLANGQVLISLVANQGINVANLGVTATGAPASFQFSSISSSSTITAPGTIDTVLPTLTTGTGNTVSLAGAAGIQNVAITNTGADAGIFGTISGNVIIRGNSAADRMTVSGGGGGAIALTDGAADSNLALANLTLSATNGDVLRVDGSTGAGVLTVSAFSDIALLGGNGEVGGAGFRTVAFDASTAAGIQQVDGNSFVAGTTGSRIGGYGLGVFNSTGSLSFATANVAVITATSPTFSGNSAAVGIYANALPGSSSTFDFGAANINIDGTGATPGLAAGFYAQTDTGNQAGFSGPVTIVTTNAVGLLSDMGSTVTASGGLVITATNGTGLGMTGGTLSVSGAGNSITTTGGTAIDLNGVAVGPSGINFTSVSANGAATGINLTGVTSSGGAIALGTVTLQGITSRGVDVATSLGAALSFADLDIGLNNSTAVAFDLNGAAINAAISANDFDVTNAAAAGTSIGIDLRGAVGGSVVRLSDAATGGASSSIAGVNTGVFLNSATNLAFVYGDGESATDQLSTISANVGIDSSSAPVAGSYNFLDVDFQNSPGLGFGVGKIYFVGAAATGDGSGRDQNNLATLATAEAASGAGDVLVLVNDGGVITASGTNTDNTLVLSDGEQVRGFGNGNINLALTLPSTIQLAKTSISIVDATPDGTATLTSSAGANTITLGSQNNIIDGFILDGAPASAARGIKDNGAGASNTVISHMTIRNFGAMGVEVTPSTGTTVDNVAFSGNAGDLLVNAANTTITNVSSTGATETAFQILNATGTTTLTNVSISGAGTGGILFSNAAGTINATNVDISGAAPLAITGGTATLNFDASSSITTSSGAAVNVSGGHSAGTFTFAGAIQATGGAGITFDNADGTYNFSGDVDLSNTSSGIAVLNGSAGSFSFTNAGSTITNPTGIAISIDGGGGGFSYAGGASKTTDGQAVSIANKSGGTVSLGGSISSTVSSDGIALSNNTGATINFAGALTLNTSASNTTAFSATGGGTVTATGTGSTINSGTAVALNMSGVAVGASGMVFGSTDKAAGGTSAVILSSITGAGTINLGSGALGGGSGPTIRIGDGAGGANTGGTAGLIYSGTIASSTAGRTIDIQDRAAGAQNITLSGNITHNVNGQTGIFLDDNIAGTITFSGASKSITSGTATAINVTDNTGATINFAGGGLVVDASSGTGFLATGGGTITVQGTNNTITSTTGTALNVANTTIGASGLTFRSISTAGSSANAGIVLDTTGSSGGLTVTGSGTTPGSGGTISNKTGADILNGGTATGNTVSGTVGTGIFLRNTANVSLANMQLNDFSNFAIYGKNVTGFTLAGTTINGTNGSNNAGDREESAIRFDNLLGSASITGSNISGGYFGNIAVWNTSGTLNRLTMSGNTFGLINATGGNDNVDVAAYNNATTNVTLNNNVFSGTRSDFFEAVANNNSTMDVVATNNNFHNGQAIISGGGTAISIRGGSAGNSSAATVTFDISGNIDSDGGTNAFDTVGIFVAKGQDLGTMSGTIANNTLVAKPGTNSDGIFVRAAGSGALTVLVQNNTITGWGNAGIHLQNNDGSATMNASVFGNSVTSAGVAFPFAAFFADNGATATDTSTMNLVLGGIGSQQNTFTGGPGAVVDVSLSNFNSGTTFTLSRNGSVAGTPVGVVQDNNVGAPTYDDSGGAGTITLVNTLPPPP